jgi:hypothetical protein
MSPIFRRLLEVKNYRGDSQGFINTLMELKFMGLTCQAKPSHFFLEADFTVVNLK